MDLYLTESGDLSVSPSGDLAMADTPWRDDVQQAYLRIMTDPGDFILYPQLGAGLSKLYGRPQSPDTGQYGINLITAALNREGRFTGKVFNVNAIPVSQQSIRFDVALTSGSLGQIKLSVEQNLGVR